MADDDIDIEEHDVLDNPVIRSIFPDISVIKKEISQYYEDVPNIKQEPELNGKDEKPPTDQILPLKVGVCEKNAHTKLLQVPEPSAKNMDVMRGQKHIHCTKIILGSKPNSTVQKTNNEDKTINRHTTESNVRILKVVLQDLGPYIYRNNRYCKDCRTMFPSKLDLDNHKQIVHSVKMKEKVQRQQISINKTLEQKKSKCNICSSYFSCNSSLKRHYRNIHKKKVIFKSKYKNNNNKTINHTNRTILASTKKTTPSMNKNIKTGANNSCFHCKKMFPDNKSLIEHIYEVLEKENVRKNISPSIKVTTTEQSKIGKKYSKIINDNQSTSDLQTLKDKLTFENQDFDESETGHDNYMFENDLNASESEPLDVVENNKTMSTKIIKDTQDSDSCVGRALRNRKKFDENQELNAHDSQASQPSVTIVNNKILSSGSKSLQKLQTCVKPIVKKQSHGSKSVSSNQKTKNHQSGPKSVEKKYQDKLVSTAYENENIEDELRLKRKTKSHQPEKSAEKKRTQVEGNLVAAAYDSIEDELNLKRKTKSQQSGPKSVKKKRIEVEDKLVAAACKNENNTEKSIKSDVDGINAKFVYQCVYCSYILPTVKAYYSHVVVKHSVEKISHPDKVLFNEKCKYCPSQSKTERGRNSHLHAYHYDLVFKHFPLEASDDGEKKSTKLKNTAFKMFESFVLESIIYKCNRCDIHFLSSSIAKDHEKHMELLINWKCFICRRIFKKHDKHLHLKQHKFSKKLNVCQFNESELAKLLYNCTKCAIHFTEERYLQHYSKCDEATTDSVYCKHCDVLIDKVGYKSHENYHKMGNNVTDFTVMVADIITVAENKVVEVDKKRKRLFEQVNCLTFCPTCKCYLSDMSLSRKAHTESRCSEIPKYICNLCGLVLTQQASNTHRDHHKKDKNLKLQDFRFFDLKGIQVSPVIPEYPRCNNCEVYFVSKNAVKNHICRESDYFTCSVCDIKLSENAFNLHMNFHNYKMPMKKNESSKVTVVTSESQKQEIEANNQESSTSNDAVKYGNDFSVCCGTSDDELPINIVYSCQFCKVAVDAYDKVIEHCQNHFSPVPTIPSSLKTCSKCSLKVECDAFENHLKLHSLYETIKLLTFDITYFKSDNNTWIQHIFDSVPQRERQKIVGESIYKHECRIKMEVVQKGPSYLTVYKCDKCGNFIDSDYLFLHTKDGCHNVRRHPCRVCGLPFISSVFRIKHEKIHRQYDNARIKTYNIVLINCVKHSTYNSSIANAVKHYVLYQCRTCEEVVDNLERNDHQCNEDNLQKCPICRLSICKVDLDKHVSKHSKLTGFNASNIKVILFGNRVESKKALSPSFGGKVYDFTLHKCSKCGVCVNNETLITAHTCIFDDSKWKCPRCMYIGALSSHKQHIEMHDRDSEFKTENINVVNFDISAPNKNNIEKINNCQDEKGSATKCEEKCSEESIATKTNEIENVTCDKECEVEKIVTIALFKCVCGLHYMDKLDAKSHAKNCNPKMRIVRQKCSKCSLTFTPKELFSHLVAHHGDKNKTYKFEVIEVSAEDDEIL